jgi:hypothetical protein
MSIAIYDMQFKDIKAQQIMWTKLNEMMLKNGFSKPKFKEFMANNTQASWNAIKKIMVLRTLLSRWLIKNEHVYSIALNHSISTPKN